MSHDKNAIMTAAKKKKLNILADMMLMNDGYETTLQKNADEDVFDFSSSTIPRCKKAWNKAVTAYAFLNHEPAILKYQLEVVAGELFTES